MRIIKTLLTGIAAMAAIPVFAQRSATIVAGQVVNRTADAPAVMTWNLCDPIVDSQMGTRLAEDGTFRFETDGITRFHNATLKYGKFINFFVAPGDSVHLLIDAAKLKDGASDAVRFGGAHAAENAQLDAVSNYLIERLYSYPEPLDKNGTPVAVVAQIKKRTEQTTDSLEVYVQRKGIALTPAVRDFVQRDMIFTLANQLLDYRREDPEARMALFGDPIFGIHDTLNLNTMMFPYHLSVYANQCVDTDTTVHTVWRAGKYAEAARKILRVLSREPATVCRDVMVWGWMNPFAEEFPALCDSVPELRTAFVDGSLYERLETFCRKMSEAPSFPDTPIRGIAYLNADSSVTEVPEGDIFAYMAAKYPEKVLYIDVYATWCGPCRAELKEAPELHKLMQGKDVVFVNLCLGSDRAAWNKLIGQLRLEGENYWFDTDATNLFLSTYQLPGYPTYILVRRDGRIATLQAGRPSDLEYTIREITELLLTD